MDTKSPNDSYIWIKNIRAIFGTKSLTRKINKINKDF